MATPTQSPITPPAIGQLWPGQGGIYAGIARGREGKADYHLVLAQAPAQECPTWQAAIAPAQECPTWQAAIDHAKTIQADGHADFALPTRWEAALLFANLRHHLKTDDWHWTSTEYEGNASYAWHCTFSHGSQLTSPKSYEGCAVAVRLIPLTA